MSEREHLVQADRLIDECKERIATQREVIANAVQRGQSIEVVASMLRAFEASLRALEKHRQLVFDRMTDEDLP
jgi:6-phosphogluconate dehydrogenase